MQEYFNKLGKYYQTPIGDLPSVTTIIENMHPAAENERLQRWRDKTSPEQQAAVRDRGKFLHQQIENYFREGKLPSTLEIEPNLLLTENIADFYRQICRTLKGHQTTNLVLKDNQPAIEYKTCHKELRYAGTLDWLGYWNQILSITDFKTTKKPKRQQYLKDQKLQLAAYKMAIELEYDIEINQGIVAYFLPDRTQIFYISDTELKNYCQEWQQLVTKFHQKFPAAK